MRVIAGTAKGHRLQSVPGDETRPITDRVKESLFNILGTWIIDSSLLDLFAGTGAVGIEALSRGASHAVFIDRSKNALRTVRANLEHTRLAKQATVIQGDAFKYLSGRIQEAFDLIYIAPPQYKGWWAEALQAIDQRTDWLVQEPEYGGIAIVQIDPREYQELALQNLVEYDQRKYGSTLLCFYALSAYLEDE